MDTGQRFLVVAGTALVSLHLGSCLLSAARRCRAGLRDLRRGFSRSTKDKVEEEVQARMSTWRLQQFQWASSVIALICLTGTLGFLMDEFYVQGLLPQLRTGSLAELSYTQFFGTLLLYAGTLLVAQRPRLLTKQSLNLWFILLASVLLLSHSTLPFSGASQPTRMGRAIFVTLAIGRADLAGAAALGLAWVLVIVGVQHRNGSVHLLDAYVDVGLTAVTGLFSLLLQRSMRQQIRTTVETEILHVQKKALQSLLRNFYDVVLDLDADWRIQGPAPDLATFLLQGQGARFEGRAFLELLHEEHRALLRERARLPAQECSLAQVVHAQLQGLSVELFCVGYESLGGTCYVIAIREYGNKEAEEKQNSFPDDAERAFLLVDIETDGMPILSASPAFADLFCPAAPGTLLTGELSKPVEFMKWVQASVNELMAGHASGGTLRTTFRTRNGLRSSATCSIQAVSEGEEGQLQAVFFFDDVARRRARSRSDRVGSHSSWSSGSSRGSGGSRTRIRVAAASL